MILQFGKYKGISLYEVDDVGYLGWLYFESDVDPILKLCVRKQAENLGLKSLKSFRDAFDAANREYQGEEELGGGDFFWKY